MMKPSNIFAIAGEQHGVKPGQIVLAWLLARSPVILPIPGTTSVEHLDLSKNKLNDVFAD